MGGASGTPAVGVLRAGIAPGWCPGWGADAPVVFPPTMRSRYCVSRRCSLELLTAGNSPGWAQGVLKVLCSAFDGSLGRVTWCIARLCYYSVLKWLQSSDRVLLFKKNRVNQSWYCNVLCHAIMKDVAVLVG